MKVLSKPLFSVVLCLTAIFLTACSHAAFTTTGGGGGGTGPFTIGGSVTGLSGTGLTLTNGTDTLTITGNNTFAFKVLVASGGTYSVAVSASPTGPVQTCTVSNGSGKATANVTNVAVTCTTGTAAIGVTVAGLSGTGLVLQNGTDFLTITGTTTTNQFKVAVPYGQTYNVVVSAQPTSPSQTCTVSGGSGTATAGVAVNVQVTCSLGTISIGGSVSGFSGGTGFVLQNNGLDNLTIKGNGAFTFPTLVPLNGPYKVTVFGQPNGPNQTCTVTGGTGTAAANVTSISVVCPAVFHPIDVNVVGVLGTSGAMTLINEGGDNLKTPKNGAYTFATPIAHGSNYDVEIIIAPGTQSEGCGEWDWTGIATSTPVNPIPLIDCGHDDWTWMDGGNTVDQLGTFPAPPAPPTIGPPPAPGIFSLSPYFGFPGTDVIISGVNFGATQGGSSVTFNGRPAVIIKAWSATSITAQVPFGATAGSVIVTVNGVASNGMAFTIPACPPLPLVSTTPGGAQYSSTWTDKKGNLWLLTGIGFTSTTPPVSPDPGYFNELWEYTGTDSYGRGCTDLWTKVQDFAGVTPARWGAVTWTDPASGDLMLFGGQDAALEFLNDLWSFSPSTHVWTQISGGANLPGTYGGTTPPISGGMPGGRWAASGRLDAAGNFWLFGGLGCDSSILLCSNNLLNDLWKYSTATKTWTWVSGSDLGNQAGSYGVKGAAASSNVPPSRQAAASWVDTSNNFWMFGGFTTGTNGFNDLWKYDTGTNQWTWISGSQGAVSTVGNYGTQGIAAPTNVPGARWLSAAWSDIHGNLWLFGGEGFDTTGNGFLGDLWEYTLSPTTDAGNPAKIAVGQWTWIRGPNAVSQPGNYGVAPIRGVFPHVTNNPGTRWAPAYWTTPPGANVTDTQFWMFGGEGFDSAGASGKHNLLNDLWRYLPYP